MKLKLYEYIDVARKIISKYGTLQMLRDDDAISYVANFIMTYDDRFNALPDKGSIEGYRYMNGKFGIKKWLSKKKKRKEFSLESYYNNRTGGNFKYDIESSENTIQNVYLNEILTAIDKLNDRDRDFVKLYFFENKTLEEISLAHDLSKERVRQIIKSALELIRVKFE